MRKPDAELLVGDRMRATRAEVVASRRRWQALVVVVLAASPACARAQRDAVLSTKGLGGVAMCAPLEQVRSVFPQVRDTVLRDPDWETSWLAKVAYLGGGEWVLFDPGWDDPAHLRAIETNSPRYRTGRGYRVGMRVRDLVDRGEPMEMHFEEGVLVVRLLADSVAFLIDDAAAERFFQQHPNYTEASVRDLPPDARIARFAVNRLSCPAR